MSDYVHESCCRQVAELRTEIERLQAENKLLNDVYEAARWMSIHLPEEHIVGLMEREKYKALRKAIAAVQEGKDDE